MKMTIDRVGMITSVAVIVVTVFVALALARNVGGLSAAFLYAIATALNVGLLLAQRARPRRPAVVVPLAIVTGLWLLGLAALGLSSEGFDRSLAGLAYATLVGAAAQLVIIAASIMGALKLRRPPRRARSPRFGQRPRGSGKDGNQHQLRTTQRTDRSGLGSPIRTLG